MVSGMKSGARMSFQLGPPEVPQDAATQVVTFEAEQSFCRAPKGGEVLCQGPRVKEREAGPL